MEFVKTTSCRWTQDDLDRIERIMRRIDTREAMQAIRRALRFADEQMPDWDSAPRKNLKHSKNAS